MRAEPFPSWIKDREELFGVSTIFPRRITQGIVAKGERYGRNVEKRIWQRFRERFPEYRGGRKDDRLPASIETVEGFASRSTRFFHWPSLRYTTDSWPRAFHPCETFTFSPPFFSPSETMALYSLTLQFLWKVSPSIFQSCISSCISNKRSTR